MTDLRGPTPGLDSFWESADFEDSDEHPLARELSHRLDAIARYARQIGDAVARGQDGMVDQLRSQQKREEEVARDLRRALRGIR
jgi:hypothetical protein